MPDCQVREHDAERGRELVRDGGEAHLKPITDARRAMWLAQRLDQPLPGFEIQRAAELVDHVGQSDDGRMASAAHLAHERRRLVEYAETKHTAAIAATIDIPWATVGRNQACPCGSGTRYKRCCQGRSGLPQRIVVDPDVLDVGAGTHVRYWPAGTFRLGDYGTKAIVGRAHGNGVVDLGVIERDGALPVRNVEVAGLADPGSACWGMAARPEPGCPVGTGDGVPVS